MTLGTDGKEETCAHLPQEVPLNQALALFRGRQNVFAHLVESVDSVPAEFRVYIEALDISDRVGLATLHESVLPAETPVPRKQSRLMASVPVSRWILDSGAVLHVVCEDSLGEVKPFKTKKTIKVSTANGEVEIKDQVTVRVDGLTEPVSGYVLKSSPDTLSIGVLCMQHGYGFHWEPFSKAPCLITPDGQAIDCKVRHNVPYIEPDVMQNIAATVVGAPFFPASEPRMERTALHGSSAVAEHMSAHSAVAVHMPAHQKGTCTGKASSYN